MAIGRAARRQNGTVDFASSHSREPTSTRVDANADAEMALLKEVVNACRTLRGEMKLSPAQKVPLIAAGDAARLAAYAPYVAALARLSDVKIVGPASANRRAGADRRRVQAHAAHRGRCSGRKKPPGQGERSRPDGEIEKLKAKLGNDNFVTRAPRNVVEQERIAAGWIAGDARQVAGTNGAARPLKTSRPPTRCGRR